MKKNVIQLDELVCPMCATKIETALKKEPGVAEISVSYNSSRAKISYDESRIDIDRIRDVITAVGYDVISVK